MTVPMLKTFCWRSDAGSGTVDAEYLRDVIALLISTSTWPTDEQIDDGAWILVELDGVRLITIGTVS